jgi:hypothetical protein
MSHSSHFLRFCLEMLSVLYHIFPAQQLNEAWAVPERRYLKRNSTEFRRDLLFEGLRPRTYRRINSPLRRNGPLNPQRADTAADSYRYRLEGIVRASSCIKIIALGDTALLHSTCRILNTPNQQETSYKIKPLCKNLQNQRGSQMLYFGHFLDATPQERRLCGLWGRTGLS